LKKGEAMVGFKFSSLIVFLSLLLVGCMPQNKQTDCGTNEAFSATLRTCVPIIPSANSFIKISSFTPSYNISVLKSSVANIYLAIGISNPYNQSYTLNWRRNFNGMDTPFTDDDSQPLNRNFTPASYSHQVGTHIITVQVLNSDNEVVDSHAWAITLTEAATPFINSPVPLNGSLGQVYKAATGLNFAVTAFNNAGVIDNSTQITWSLDSGVPVPGTECSVANLCYSTNPTASSTANFTTPATNTLTVGSHTVTAVLRDNSRIYAQFTWTFNVVNPPKAKVAAVYTVDNDSNSNNYTIVARTGVPYSNVYDDGLVTGFRNFFLTNAAGTTIYNDATRANFCIDFERDYGSQVGSYIDVRFYLDGNASPVATVSTSAADDKICLSDAAAANLLNVIYNNANPNATENHILRARIFDQAIVGVGKEYTYADDFQAGSGAVSYPIDWTIVVKPQNDAPGASFGATQLSSVLAATPLNCVSNTALEKSGCEVFTDTDFRVSLLALTDDYFMPPYAAYADANFNYTLRLYRNTTLVHTCSKTLAGMDATTDSTGPEFACTFSIPSFGALGPIDTDPNDYTIEGEISDVGSLYSAYGAVAKTTATFKWNLDVKETNNAPVIASITPNAGTLNEGDTINFSVSVDDLDRDNHTQEFFLCTLSSAIDPSCSVNVPLPDLTENSSRTTNALNTTVISSFTMAEDFLHQLTDPSFNCRNLSRGQTCSGLRILTSVTDIPSTVAEPGNNVTQILTFDVVNTNPAPQFNEAQYSPDESLATHEAVVGVPFVLNPGTITDASNALVLTERENRYQWYSSTDNTSWVSIPGATSIILNWTPASEIAASGNNIYLKLCTQDQPSYVIATVDEEVCSDDVAFGGSSSWVIRSHRNYVALDGTDPLPSTKNLMAVWKGIESTNSNGIRVTPVYTAYLDDNDFINVEKSVLSSTGGYLPSGFSKVSFSAVPPLSGNATIIKDLSITGTNNSLYISYLLSTDLTPTQFRLQVRRIDIGGTKSNIIFADNKSFGFSYTNITAVSSNGADVTVGSASDSSTGVWQTLKVNNSTDATITLAGVPLDPCPSICSATDYALAIISAINSSADLSLQGTYAELDSGDNTLVYIKGVNANNSYSDVSTSVTSLGQIYISTGNWNTLYVISTSNKLNAKTAPVDVQMTFVAPSTTLSTVAGLNAIQASTSIATSNVFNEAGTDYVIVGSIATSGSIARAYKLAANGFASATVDSSVTGLFGAAQTYSLKVAATSGVNKYFLVADAYDSAISQRNFFFVKFGAGMGIEISKTVSDPTFANASTIALFDYNGVYDINLAAYTGGTARVFLVSDNTSVTPMMFSASIKADNTLSCHGCAPVSGGPEVSNLTSIALSPVRFKTSCVANGLTQAHCLLGTEGYDSTPGVSTDDSNYKDVIFTGYTVLENTPSDFQPAVGVFNMESESIHSSSLDSVDGKYRPPFFTP
jgi:hypothetical protein